MIKRWREPKKLDRIYLMIRTSPSFDNINHLNWLRTGSSIDGVYKRQFQTLKYYMLVIFFICHLSGFSQTDSTQVASSKPEKTFLKQSIVPLSLIGAGLIVNYSNGFFGKENLQENIQDRFPDFSTNADDYLLFAPAVIMYAADIFKVPSKNDAFTQTKYLVISAIASNIIVFSLKNITNEERPDGSGDDSFPSGHTTNSFVMATVLFHEFKDTKPILAYSGFAFATATGVLRVLNNAHWVSDVLVGAGIGIIITDLVYRFEPLKNWDPFKNKKMNAIISPSYLDNKFGLYANIQF